MKSCPKRSITPLSLLLDSNMVTNTLPTFTRLENLWGREMQWHENDVSKNDEHVAKRTCFRLHIKFP